jgi:hypothetical protein
VTLAANTAYFLVSEEFFNGDSWYDQSTRVTTTSVALCNGAVWLSDGAVGGGIGFINRTFGPVDFQYETPP